MIFTIVRLNQLGRLTWLCAQTGTLTAACSRGYSECCLYIYSASARSPAIGGPGWVRSMPAMAPRDPRGAGSWIRRPISGDITTYRIETSTSTQLLRMQH